MKKFHYLLAGLDVDQLKQISINSNDILDVLSNRTDWDTEQVSPRFSCFNYLFYTTNIMNHLTL